MLPPNAHPRTRLSPQGRGLMEDITLDPDDPAWLSSPNDTSLPEPNATSDLLQAGLFSHHAISVDNAFSLTQPRSPVPAVASAYSSVSPSPFAPPSRSSPPERENDTTAISVTGPGDDPAPVSRKNDGQTDPTRTTTSRCAIVALRVSPSLSLRVPPGAPPPRNPCTLTPHVKDAPLPPFLLLRRHFESRSAGYHIHRLLFLLLTITTSSAQPAQDQETEGTGAIDGIRPRTIPPGAHKSDYMPVKQRFRTRQRQTAAKRKARAGNNAGSKDLVHVLQVAFENNWPGAGSTGPSGKKTKKAA
ncbi:hypothetical protein EDB83DRAFT_2518282 [Lactarius deliciosus]|nr:hypothetical protein EDB83DRAFT_2518282 [Lactarius deliciosus]